MIVRRRTWLYRLAGQKLVQMVSFEKPVTTARARDLLKRTVGVPVELWGRSSMDVAAVHP